MESRVHLRFLRRTERPSPARLPVQNAGAHVPGPRSVKDLIESCGVPHTEVELIVVNGVSVDFSYVCTTATALPFTRFSNRSTSHRRCASAAPLRDPRFVLDVHLGKLAAYMRMLGFDTAVPQLPQDAELARISATTPHPAHPRSWTARSAPR